MIDKPHRHTDAIRVHTPPETPALPVLDYLTGPGHPSNRSTFDQGSEGSPAAGQGGGRREGGKR